jgi:hypothetical protein
MIGVDLIGDIRRAYFEQKRPIKEIVRTLSVSRTTVRRVIRSQKTAFKYERGVQPAPKLGEWVKVLVEILEAEAKLPRRERRSTQRLFEELRGRGAGLCSAELRPGRGLPVRLEPRDDHAARIAAGDQGGAHEAVAQPHAVRARLLPRDAGVGVRRARQSVRILWRRMPARHLRQHEDRGGSDFRRQGASI